MPALGDLRVAISVDKQQRSDYHDEDTTDQNAKFISRYVECKSGASFSVEILIQKTMKFKSDAIIVYVDIDGRKADSIIISQLEVSSTGGGVYFKRISGATRKIANHWEFRPFMFGEIKHVEQLSGPVAIQHDRKTLGSIAVKVHQITRKDAVPAKESSWDEAKNPSHAITLSEHQLKGSSATHAANYGMKQHAAACEYVDVDFVDGRDSPFAHFQFKYRSKKALQSILLIPRTPSPPPPPRPIPLEERPVESLSVEELQQLVRRQRPSTSLTQRKESQTAKPNAKSKLESTLAEQHIKREGEIKRQSGIKSEQEVKSETGVKRERDKEMEEILASAYVKRPKNTVPVDLTDV
ncbi:MAG: hypothetical protein L6R42_005588 [Xanthoria sp. 1 TBL-2021]|nr:MAG: hypothetical protein L6R42_005588 [Xanthoria sp. 1 TBL-2021]